MVLGIVQQVDIGEELHLGWSGHVGLTGENLATVLGGLDDQGALRVIPVSRLLILGEGMRHDFLTMDFRIQIRMEGVFSHPALEARPGLF